MREIKKIVRYYVQKRSSWPDQSPLRLRNVELAFNYDGERLCALTGMKVALCDWDEKRQRVKVTVKRSGEVNCYLDQLEQKINDIYFKAKADGIQPDNHYIRKELRKGDPQERSDFFKEWLKFVELNKNRFATGTVKSMMTAYNRFKEFMGGKRIDFDDVTPELLAKYADFLLGVGNVNITVHGNIKRLKIFMNYAKEGGLHSNDSYKKFKWKVREARKFFLEWSEVKMLYDYKPESDFERKIVDKFLMCVFTAQRFSDIHLLRKEAIRTVTFPGDKTIYHAAYLSQRKTDCPVVVPLLEESLVVLARYKDQPGEFALPRICGQVVNRHIKLIARKAGITTKTAVDIYRGNNKETKYYDKCDLIGTHAGRKSFVTRALSLKLAPGLVAETAGMDERTMQGFYAGVIDRDKFVQVMKDMSLTPDADKKGENTDSSNS